MQVSQEESKIPDLAKLISILIEEFNCNAQTLDIYKRE
jgi:hypothetical protein